MIKSSIVNFANEIGFEIGTSDDVVQAKLINGFCKGLRNSILREEDLSMQLCYIAEKLDDKTEKILFELVEFIQLKNKN